MTCFIGGNSHVGALRHGMDAHEDLKEVMEFVGFGSGVHELENFSTLRQGRVEFLVADYARSLQNSTGKPYFDPADLWGICQGTHDARILRAAYLRSGAAPSATAQPGQMPLSNGVLDVFIEQDQAPVRTFLTQLKSASVPVFVVSCAPVRNNGRPAKLGVPLDTIRYVSFRARRLFTDFLKEAGIDFVAPPPETIDEDGFLKTEYCQFETASGKADGHHANAHYGKLMVRRIADYVTSRHVLA